MKVLAILLLASLPVPQVQSTKTLDAQTTPHFAPTAQVRPKKGGKWYFARSGHAVYCYGPVMTVTSVGGSLQRVATFCKGEQIVVPLKD